MTIEVDRVKGFQDIMPPESLKRNKVRKIIEKYFQLYGFLPVETPVIEFDETMRSDNLEKEDEAVSDRFRLKDRGGRNLGLRYEFTFQLARIMKSNPNMKLPFRRYQIGEVFRDEPIGTGRYRQFTQCDADIIGDSSVESEAECLVLVSEALKEMKINLEIQVNNRKLINSIIESVEIKEIVPVMRELDKLEKLGEDIVKSNLLKYADSNRIITLFKLLQKDLKFYKDNAFDGAQEIEDLIEECSRYGIKIKFNPFMIRGLGYYTGNIFEIKEPGKNSIAAGGRYDKLVGKYINKQIPSVGISFGLDRVCELAKIKVEGTKVIVISLNQDKEMIKTGKFLRKSGISCITTSEKVGKALEFANALEIPYAVFIGDEELQKKKFKLKEMKSGTEKYFTEKQLLKVLSAD